MTENPFHVTDLTYDEYRNQDVITVDDGAFFDALDEGVGIVPRTNDLNPDWKPKGEKPCEG